MKIFGTIVFIIVMIFALLVSLAYFESNSPRDQIRGWIFLSFVFAGFFLAFFRSIFKQWKVDRQNDPAVHNNKGIEKAKRGQSKEAITDFDKAIELNPEDSRVYDNRGWAKAQSGQFEEAFADYDKSIELDPNFATAYLHRGLTNGILGRFEEALNDYKNAIAIQPDFAAAYAAQGYTLENLERSDEARESLRKGLFLANNQKNKEVVSEIVSFAEQMKLNIN